MFRFEHIEYLYLLGIIPFLIIVYVVITFIKRRNLKFFGEPSLMKRLILGFSSFRYNLKFFLMIVVIALIVIALAGPQFGTKLVDVKQRGLEIIIALDVSNSMMAEDILPNRLERAKQELMRLMDRLDNDKIGLIVFAGEAYTQIPITSDIPSAKMFLSSITTNMVSRQGTAIGSAIQLATNSFSPNHDAGKALIIISDGENHEGDILEASEEAMEKNINIFTIGMGQSQGVRIPVSTRPYNRDYLRDREGNFVITRLNEQMLAEIASLGDGKYYRISAQGMGWGDFLNQLEELDRANMESQVYEEYEEKFPYFIWAAFFILILDLLVFEKKGKWFSKQG